jgi:DNA helicase HerA-like ATPase
MLASQRPSELSPTVLAQCGTLVVHRTVNPQDQELIASATAFAGRDVLKQLPGLATQHAVVMGEAVAAPTYVRIREIADPPRSEDPDFIGRWRRHGADVDETMVDAVADKWEAEGVPEVPLTED